MTMNQPRNFWNMGLGGSLKQEIENLLLITSRAKGMHGGMDVVRRKN